MSSAPSGIKRNRRNVQAHLKVDDYMSSDTIYERMIAHIKNESLVLRVFVPQVILFGMVPIYFTFIFKSNRS
jgi:hypothetical protein